MTVLMTEPGAAPGDDPAIPRLEAWLAANVGGTVRRAERQPRWRPVWFVDVEQTGDAGAVRAG